MNQRISGLQYVIASRRLGISSCCRDGSFTINREDVLRSVHAVDVPVTVAHSKSPSRIAFNTRYSK